MPASRSPHTANEPASRGPHPDVHRRPTLAAEHREITGKAVAGLRRAGRLPAVVYGHGVESTNLSVDTHDFEQLRRRTGPNALVDLSIDGKKAKPVLINGVQVHPVNRKIVHVDLFLVRMTEEMTVDVPLVPIGSSPAIDDAGGTLLHMTETVTRQGAAGPPAAVDRVLDRGARGLRRRHLRSRTVRA